MTTEQIAEESCGNSQKLLHYLIKWALSLEDLPEETHRT